MSTEHTPAMDDKPISATNAAGPQAFTFGEPEAVMDRREILDYVECWLNGEWYETPISFDGLARSLRAATHHGSAVHFKAQVVASTFRPHPLLSRATVHKLALDFITFGNGYLERVSNRLGGTLELRHALAKYMRRGKTLNSYWFVRGWQQEHEFAPGAICHVIEPDVHQEIYGLPQYLASLQSAWLNESATLFRRRYYNNGSHAGFILYLTDPAQDQSDVDAMRGALKSAKGVGNFKNLFYYSPNGKKDGITLIPIGEAAAKDEFFNIKNVSRDDQLAAHRVPPQLMGVVPANAGGFGDVVNAARVFARNEIQPLQSTLATAINDWAGEVVAVFDPYQLHEVEPAAGGGLVK